METRVHSHTRESLNKSDGSRDRTHGSFRKCSDSRFCLTSSDRETHTSVGFSKGWDSYPLPQPVIRKGVNTRSPVRLGLEYEATGGGIRASHCCKARASAPAWLSRAVHLASGEGECKVVPPGCTQTQRLIVSSSCEIPALQRGRSVIAPVKGEHTRLDQRPASAGQPPPPPCKCHPSVNSAFDPSFLGKLTLFLLPATSTCSQKPTKKKKNSAGL